jgi:hypothetical protein
LCHTPNKSKQTKTIKATNQLPKQPTTKTIMNSIFIEAPKKKVINTMVTPSMYKKDVITDEKLKNSLATMKASFDDISAAKHHTKVIEAPTSRKVVAGYTKKIVTKAGPSTGPSAGPSTKPIVSKTTTTTVERKPILVGERKAAKKSQISRLIKGKTFDMS